MIGGASVTLTNFFWNVGQQVRGANYDGLHEPIVAPEVWYRVQAVLTAHQASGEKTQSHDHYLYGQYGSRSPTPRAAAV